MSYLLFASDDARVSPFGTRIGGRPYVREGFDWPTCARCGAWMHFLAQVDLADATVGLDDKALYLFQCQAQPGECEDWEAFSGGNAACLYAKESGEVCEPPNSNSTLPLVSVLQEELSEQSLGLQEVEDAYHAALRRFAVGKVGGVALWLQNDEVPKCECGEAMCFAVQIDARFTGMSFGDGGTGFGFVCAPCNRAGFLWQTC